MRPAFFGLEEFPVLLALAQAWPEMRQDLDALHAPLMDIDRVGKPHAVVVGHDAVAAQLRADADTVASYAPMPGEPPALSGALN